jgi:mono/diheme cytochrome c family protein
MRILVRVLGILVVLIVLAVAGILIYLFAVLPKKEPPAQITVEATPQRLERGEYLVRHVVMCTHCHADRNMQVFATPPVAETEGKGGFFLKEKGLGELYSPNITPYAIGDWTDGELIRAVTAGVNKDGDPLFPIMPYQIYASLKQEDLYSVIAYIRSLKPIEHETPERRLEFPLNLIVRTIPGPAEPDTQVQSNPGHYLVKVAGCMDCHTPVNDRRQHLPGKEFSGGQKFGNVQSANITPDEETGIGKWSREDFIAAFKKWQDPSLQNVVMPENQNTVMPWIDFSGMKEEDLSAIYDYLRSVPPIRNKVERFPEISKAHEQVP